MGQRAGGATDLVQRFSLTMDQHMSQELKNRIHADYPELRDPRLPDWDKARILRTWTWSLVDVAWPRVSYDQQKDWHRSEADRLVERFD